MNQKREAFQQLIKQGWVIIRDDMVPVNRWEEWRACAVWPEPVTTDPKTTWAIIDCAGHDPMDAGLPLRFGMARSPSIDALTLPDAQSGRSVAEWSWGTYWTPLIEIGRVPELYSRAIVVHFTTILRDAPHRFGPHMLELISQHIPDESFGAIMARWAFSDGWGNNFLRAVNGYLGVLPAAVDEALHTDAHNPWHWPPWAPEGQPIPDPRDGLLRKPSPVLHQDTLCDARSGPDPTESEDLAID